MRSKQYSLNFLLRLGAIVCLSLGLYASALTIAPNKTSHLGTSLLSSPKINWRNLSAEQQTALAPLSSEWDGMDEFHKKKWLGIAAKYTQMKPEEQQRVQERVSAWVKLTPAQRMAIRENFASTAKKTPEQKSAQWQQYQLLSDEEKQKLSQDAKTTKTITSLQPQSKRKEVMLQPLKKNSALTAENNPNQPPPAK